MVNLELEARKREVVGKKLKSLRAQGAIPAIVYGKKLAPLQLFIDKKVFVKTILGSEAGMNAIVNLKVTELKGQPLAVLTHEIQRNPLTDEILHIDFRQIVMDEMIKIKVPIELTGLPTGVKDDGGVLIHGLREVEIECLPGNIPDKFSLDVAALKIGDSLHVSDIKTVDKVKILTNPSEMVANCSPPTKGEEVAAPIPTPEEAAAAAAGPVVAEEEGKDKAAPAAAAKDKAPAKEAAPAAKTEKK